MLNLNMDVVWIGFLSAATIAVLLVMWMYLSTKQKTYSTDTISTQSSSTPTTTKPYLKYLVPGLLLLILAIIFVPPLFDDAPEGPQKDKVVDTEPSVTNGNEDTGAIEGQDENSDQVPSSETEPTLSVSEDILDKFGSSTDLIIVVGLVTALIWALWVIFFKKKSVPNQNQDRAQDQSSKSGSSGTVVTLLILAVSGLSASQFFPEETSKFIQEITSFLGSDKSLKEDPGQYLEQILVVLGVIFVIALFLGKKVASLALIILAIFFSFMYIDLWGVNPSQAPDKVSFNLKNGKVGSYEVKTMGYNTRAVINLPITIYPRGIPMELRHVFWGCPEVVHPKKTVAPIEFEVVSGAYTLNNTIRITELSKQVMMESGLTTVDVKTVMTRGRLGGGSPCRFLK